MRRVCGWFWKPRREAQPQHADLQVVGTGGSKTRQSAESDGSSATTSASGDRVLWDPIKRREGDQNFREKTLRMSFWRCPGYSLSRKWEASSFMRQKGLVKQKDLKRVLWALWGPRHSQEGEGGKS